MKTILKTILCVIACACLLCGCAKDTPPANNVVGQTHNDGQKPSSGDVSTAVSTPRVQSDATKENPAKSEKVSSDASSKKPQTTKEVPSDAASQKPQTPQKPINTSNAAKGKIIVLDPGHGKSSSLMSEDEKKAYGYTYVQGRGWGEWRHFKSGTMWHDCEGQGCSKRAPQNGSCWYSIGAGDRNTEPELTYNNAISAKKYLEQMGYTVRLTRNQNENPSITQRIKNCYPNGDTNLAPDASAYVCIHSNAGGGRGSCYISLSGLYDQGGINNDYIAKGNALGQAINDRITQTTSMPKWGNGIYTGYPELVLFCKSPVPVAYLEIGFYDNATDLGILQSESDSIGRAIAEGIDAYYREKN